MVDIARPDAKRKKQTRRILYIAGAVIVVAAATLGVSRLKPAAPSVERANILSDKTKRGLMLIEDRGVGTLVPENIRVIPAATDGRVEQRLLLPGSQVKADSLILILSNPELQQAALDADYQLRGAESELRKLKADLDNQLMEQRAKAAGVRSEYHQAKLQADTNKELFDNGLTADVVMKTSQVKAEELAKQNAIAEQQVEAFQNSIAAQLGVQEARVDEARALANLKHQQVEQLRVRAGIAGVLQELPVEAGQQVTPGIVLARVVQPQQLKAELKIAETQAKDVQIGQKVSIDTHNGIIAGHVTRIDPAVQNGTVTVDASLEGALPPGARPDLSVEGTIEIARLPDVLYVGRPVHGEPESTISLFKLTADGSEAVRVQVKLGRASVNTVEILSGLELGDQVILSDMSASENYDRIRLK